MLRPQSTWFLWSDCWQRVPAALPSHLTVECREKLFARWILKTFKEKKKKKPYLVAFPNRLFACVETTGLVSWILALQLAKCSCSSEHRPVRSKTLEWLSRGCCHLWWPEQSQASENSSSSCVAHKAQTSTKSAPLPDPLLLWLWFKEVLCFEIPGMNALAQSGQNPHPNSWRWGLCHLPHPQANNHRPSLLEIRRPFVEEWTSQIAQFQKTQRVSSDAPYCDAELPLQDQSPGTCTCRNG